MGWSHIHLQNKIGPRSASAVVSAVIERQESSGSNKFKTVNFNLSHMSTQVDDDSQLTPL